MQETFVTETFIAAPVEKLFDFRLNPDNIALVAPAGVKIIEVTKPSIVTASARYTIQVNFYGFAQHWEISFEQVDRPQGLPPRRASIVGRAHAGPLSNWRHRQELEERGSGTVIRDIVHYTVPGSWWFVPVLTVMRTVVRRVFTELQLKTKEYLEKTEKA